MVYHLIKGQLTVLTSNITTEIWKDIPNYEGHYQVSNFGRVRGIKDPHGNYREYIRTPYKHKNGYLFLGLWKENNATAFSVHRLVALAFLPNPNDLPEVNHKDGIKTNNYIDNLEWVSTSENRKHAWDAGLRCRQAQSNTMKGRKYSNKSKYHNVSYDSNRDKWIASIKVDRKTTGQKRFSNEKDAAKHVNYLLDLHSITDRPRNII